MSTFPAQQDGPTPFITTGAQARLDNEIAALALVLSDLRTQRNALSPVSRLPTEILASIFVQCAHGLHEFRRGVPDWVNVSYVCHRWRDVALSCSLLWSFLFVSSQRWTDELLARSKTAPLKVHLDSEYSKQSRELHLLERVAPLASRIQNLGLRLTRREAERILSMLSSPAPILQTLQISVERSSYVGENALVTGVLFDGCTPALRKLELINYAFPLTSPTLGGLTYLRLRDLGRSLQPTLDSFFSTLGQMRELIHLHLENALPSARTFSVDQSFKGAERLAFPKLTRLSIVAPFTTVVLLLSSFDISLDTQVRLRCCFEPHAENYTPIYPLLAKRFTASKNQKSTAVPIIRTSFVETVSAVVGFIFSTAKRDSGRRAYSAATTSYELGHLHEDWDCNIPLKIDIVLRTSLRNAREKLVGGVCHSVPLTGLQSAHFSLDGGPTLSSSFWTQTFGHLQELRYMRLSGVNLQGFVRALSPTLLHLPEDKSRNKQASRSAQVFTPALQELDLHNAPFAKICYGRVQGNPDNCACSAPCLYDALFNREAVGHGLQRLHLAECMYVRDYDFEGVRGSVTEVDWDGISRTVVNSDGEDEVDDTDVGGSWIGNER